MDQNLRQDKKLLLIYTALLAFTLLIQHIAVLAFVALASVVMFVYSGAMLQSYRKYLLILLFILLGTLPLLLVKSNGETGLSYPLLLGWGISEESLLLAAGVLLRAVATSTLVLLLLHYLPVYRFCQLLRSCSVPTLLVELIELSYRYIHLLGEQGQHIYEAQKLRFAYQGLSNKYKHSSLLFAQTFVLAHAESEQIYEGLQTRQFMDGDNVKRGEVVGEMHMKTKDLLQLKDISFRYKGADATSLSNVTLSFGRGERIALLGANGAGKSTLMRLVAGLHREESGVFILKGEELDRSPTSLRKQRLSVALVMQNANHQLFCPSVEDELAFGLRNSGMSDEEVGRRVEQIVECYELQELRAKAPHQLSEGQKKWVSIASIMALEPEVILMDEPTACLDCYYTDKVLSFIQAFCDRGGTVMLSTHDMHLAYEWATRAVVIQEGSIIYDGDMQIYFSEANRLKVEKAKLRLPAGLRVTTSLRAGSPRTHNLGLYHETNHLRALVYGGGRGAERKIDTLTQAGVVCDVVAPNITEQIKELLSANKGSWTKGLYREYSGILSSYHLIIAGTDDEHINAEICLSAGKQGRMYCNLSNPNDSSVHFAAQYNQAGLQVAVHSEYQLPEITALLRDLFAEHIDKLDASLLGQLSEYRKHGMHEQYKELKEQIRAKLIDDRTHKC